MKPFLRLLLLALTITFAANFSAYAAEGATSLAEMSLEDILSYLKGKVPLNYGYEKSPVELHVFMNTALWNFEKQAIGKYANQGAATSGYPYFITYSGYIDISCQLTRQLYGEAEFELYKGQSGSSVKVTTLKQVWIPSESFRVSLGRALPPIGIQDYVYYPTSQYRLFAFAPYLYWSVLRATGWWDSGVFVNSKVPLKFIGPDASLHIDAAVINGPGDAHQATTKLVDMLKPNSDGYFFEFFHEEARQPWDNNGNKYYPVRLSLEPIPNMLIGASYADGKYDAAEKYGAAYTFAHFLYGGDRLTIASEYGQLKVDVNPAYMMTAANAANGTTGNSSVTQNSYYVSAGYKVLKEKYVYSFEPVIRYEFMDSWKEDSLDKGDRQLWWLGFRLSPYKHWTFKAGYSFQNEPSGPTLKNDGYILESVLEF